MENARYRTLDRPHWNDRHLLPGILLSTLISGAAYGVGLAQSGLTGRIWLEPLVLAILIGTAVRSVWTLPSCCRAGIAFSAKYLLEIAVVLLGLSVSAATLLAVGPALLVGIFAVVSGAIVVSFGIGRLLGIPDRMALLIACGNSICGNSAIAAVAPSIGADSKDVAASIAFTAVLGVAVVVALPLLGLGLDLTANAYGTFAGLTVYAVPQVIAATSPFGASAVQTGTLVKLIRVMMLGPVCLVLSLLTPRLRSSHGALSQGAVPRRPSLARYIPWFIIGFFVLMAIRSSGLVPETLVRSAKNASTFLTVISMAALGLGVELRTVVAAGGRVAATVILSLLSLGLASLALLRFVGMY